MRSRLKLGFITLSICLSFIFSASYAESSVRALPQGLRVDVDYVQHEGTVWGVLWLRMRADYHAYANDVGTDTGRPTTITVKDASGKQLAVQYPAGTLERDVYNPSRMVRVYSGDVPLFIKLPKAAGSRHFEGGLSLLLCSVKHCIPVNYPIKLYYPKQVQVLPSVDSAPYALWWDALNVKTAETTEPASKFSVASVPAQLSPETHGAHVGATTSTIEQAGDSGWTFSPRSVQEELEVTGLGKALLLGLLAGLLLNVMPCVLPVLTLKTSAMLVVGEGNQQHRMMAFRVQNLLFAAGILTQFLFLAVLLGTAGFIWGQLFQSLAFVSSMLVIVFLLGLSMLGLFTLPVVDLKATACSSPKLQAYLTGIMATLLATPCSGPLLGGVLSWAFMQPLQVLIVVFLAVGLGMSMPYILFAIKPSVVSFIPRPGAWMAVLERLVGFFLLGTSLYLLSILPQDLHIPMLGVLLLVAVGGWIWGYFGGLSAPPLRRKLTGLLFAGLVVCAIVYGARPPIAGVVWETFDAATFRNELGKTPMLVEFTADWCPNCKFVERTVLTAKRLQRWQDRYGLKLVRVDLTRNNEQGEALLQALGSSSIPLTAIFGTGLKSSVPIVVRDIYSAETLDIAIKKAFPR